MRCAVNDPWDGRCPNKATETLPTRQRVCSRHACEWAEGRIQRAKKQLAEAERLLAGRLL